jgi:hypothetical protein
VNWGVRYDVRRKPKFQPVVDAIDIPKSLWFLARLVPDRKDAQRIRVSGAGFASIPFNANIRCAGKRAAHPQTGLR